LPQLVPTLLVIVFVLTAVALGGYFLKRAALGTSGLWTWAWGAFLAGGALDTLFPPSPASAFSADVLGTLFAALLLAGAFRWSGRRIPAWLPAATAVACLVRGLLSVGGRPELSASLALALEPAAEVGAAVLVLRSGGTRLVSRLLASSLALLAGLDAWLAVVELLAFPHPHAAMLVPGMLAVGTGVPVQLFALIYEMREREGVGSRARQQAEAALRESMERFQAITSNGFDLVAELDPQLCLTYLSPNHERVLGLETARLVGGPVLELLAAEDRERVGEGLRAVARAGGQWEGLARWCDAAGRAHWVETKARAFRSGEGELRVVISGLDVTERVELTQRLRLAREDLERRVGERTAELATANEDLRRQFQQRQRAEVVRRELEARVRDAEKLESLGLLAGGIAHDFNNLLTVILGNTAVLLRDLPADSPLRPRLERIHKTADYGAGLTQQILTYAGGAATTRKPLDLSRVVEDMAGLLESGLPRAVRVEAEFADGIPPVEADETQVRQIVMNLMRNAAEAMGEAGGALRVRTGTLHAERAYLERLHPAAERAEGCYAFLEVSDEGPGIDEATRARVFDPFFTTRLSGRGLGLAAVLGIVRGHGGAIELETREGVGTTFRVLFPIRAGAQAQGGAEGAPPPERGAPRTVLVIDDDDAVLEITKEFLERAGLPVLLAESGREGLAALEERGAEVGAVVLDFQMPDLDGALVLREIRQLRPELPVIVATGYANESAAREALRDSASVVQKPYDPDALVLRVLDALDASGGRLRA
jgi:two-component system cell cycle sensor histidine kinase/response regulator CckA